MPNPQRRFEQFNYGLTISRDIWDQASPAEKTAILRNYYDEFALKLARHIVNEQLATCSIQTLPVAQRVINISMDARVERPRGHWLTSEEVAPSSHDSERTRDPVVGWDEVPEPTGSIGALPRGDRERAARDRLERAGNVVPYAGGGNLHAFSAYVDGVRRTHAAGTASNYPAPDSFPDDNSLGHTDSIHAELRNAGYHITPNTNSHGNPGASASNAGAGSPLTAAEVRARP